MALCPLDVEFHLSLLASVIGGVLHLEEGVQRDLSVEVAAPDVMQVELPDQPVGVYTEGTEVDGNLSNIIQPFIDRLSPEGTVRIGLKCLLANPSRKEGGEHSPIGELICDK